MDDRQRIIDEFRRGIEGPAWHGPSVLEILSDVTHPEAALRPLPAWKSIWELVLHMAAWQNFEAVRLSGKEPDVRPDTDWAGLPEPSKEDWRATLLAFRASADALEDAIANAAPERLEQRIERTGLTFREHLDGIINHNAYHSAQIALLKRLVRT